MFKFDLDGDNRITFDEYLLFQVRGTQEAS